MTDRLLSAQRRHDAAWTELEAQLAAVMEAALAETLAKLWRLVLGERVAVTAAAQPPSLDGAEQAARETWTQALTRWVRPILFAHYQREYDQAAPGDATAPVNARDSWWADTLARVAETADKVVQAVRETIAGQPTESIDQLRDRVAGTLGLDAPSKAIRDEIADTEARLAGLGRLTTAQRGDLYARKVRLQAELFRIEASRARSQAYTALAQAIPDDADQFRDLARQSARSAGDLDRLKRELATVDDQLFKAKRDPSQDEAAETARLKRRRQHLYGQVDEADETWRNKAQLIARTESTNVLNEASLRRAIDSETASGTELLKVWISKRDERVRDTHEEAHNQAVPLADKFTVGVSLMERPGDPTAPIEEVANCRCTITFLTRAEHQELAAVLAAAGGWFAPNSTVYDMAGAGFEARVAALEAQEETMSTPVVEPMAGTDLEALPPVQWHGVITVEDVYTGDRRKFTAGALRTQPLPMPLRWARTDFGGHDGALVVGNIEGLRRYQGQIRAWGTFADGSMTPEVDELQGLMATRMMRGISIDGDDILDSQFEVEIDAEQNLFQVYTSARLRSSTLVAIPAYDEAEVFIGPAPDTWLLEGEPVPIEQNDPETRPVELEDLDALVADVSRIPENLADYWTHGEGAAKIRWGTDGDFNRCRQQLARYVSPGQVSGTCANLHHRALGVWPGQEAAGETIIAAAGQEYTLADFAPWDGHETGPGESGVTPITVTDDGHVYGTVAPWGACHTGYSDRCVNPPPSKTQYGYFHTGGVKLADGTVLPIGKLTATGGHANTKWDSRRAMAHYDDTTAGVALVRAFENAVGIQISGVILSTATPEQVAELLASPLSGDWRPVREGHEMIAAHCVNNPGFAVRRPEPVGTTAKAWALVATVGGKQTALITGCASLPQPMPAAEVLAKVQTIAASIGMDRATQLAALTDTLAPLTAREVQARVAALAARIPISEEA